MHVVATAGHVDHGKSTLVRALTGMEPDRFAEERRRGMTIDLGFAWTTLKAAGDVSFVDVPGHQRFIANMLAGLGPAPVVLFVVAADAGWSAQSADHLAAIDALQIRDGVLAVTRCDLADPTDVLADSRARIAATALGSVPAVAVSGATGAGLAHLRRALDEVLATRMPAPREGRVRLWVDRSFSVRGSGTVVTGTLGAGTLSVGDDLQLPGRRARVHVRGVQTNGAARESIGAAARVALNLRNVDHADVARGDALLTPGAWHVSELVDVRVRPAADLPQELMLHIGTAAVAVHVRELGAGFVRLRLIRPLPLAPGDRGVLRDPGRQVVGAGVEVLDVDPPPLNRRGAAARRADELTAAGGLPSTTDHVLRRQVVSHTELARLGVAPDASADDRVRVVGELLVAEGAWQGWRTALTSTVTGWAARDPLQPHPTPAAVRDAIGLPPQPALLSALIDQAGVRVVDGRLAPSKPVAAKQLPPGVATLVQRLSASAFDAPTRDELHELGLGRRELATAVKAGALLVLGADTGDVVLLPDAPHRARAAIAALPQPFTLSSARQALASTRRVVVPLLEELDRRGLTTRVDALTRSVRERP